MARFACWSREAGGPARATFSASLAALGCRGGGARSAHPPPPRWAAAAASPAVPNLRPRGRRPNATAAGRVGRCPGPGCAVRRREPRLPARIPGLPRGPRAVLGRPVHLRALRGRRVHRAVRLLAGLVTGTSWLATRRGVAVRATATPPHPPAVLGRPRLQPCGGLAGH